MLGLDEYWSEMGGIFVRLEMFGEQLQYKTYNQAVVITASTVGIFNLKMVGPLDERTCDWCAEHVGRVYRSNQGFMPILPKHPNCRHWWDIEYLGEKPQKRLKRGG